MRTRIYDLVPKGRLNLAQDASPGYLRNMIESAGTAEGGLRRGPISAVLRLGRPFKSNPRLASWAKFSRPFGTRFGAKPDFLPRTIGQDRE